MQTFYFFTAFIFVVGTICVSFVPSRINKKAAGVALITAPESTPPVENPYRQSITYFTILRNRRALSTIIMCIYAMTASQVVVPVLSVRLTTPPFNLSDAGAGYAFGLMGGAQALGAPFAGWMGTQMPIKWVSQIGCCALILAFFFSGPSLYFKGWLPDTIPVILFGLGLMGFCSALMYVLVTPEVIDACSGELQDKLAAKFRSQGESEKDIPRLVKREMKNAGPIISDRTSALSEMSFALGSLLGPILGGRFT